MIYAGLAWRLLSRYGWVIAAGLAVWWVLDMRSDLAEQRDTIATLRSDLEAEQLARARDTAALTRLAAGLTQAAADTATDRKALADATLTATPVSPALVRLLDSLRQADQARAGKPAGRTGGAPAR